MVRSTVETQVQRLEEFASVADAETERAADEAAARVRAAEAAAAEAEAAASTAVGTRMAEVRRVGKESRCNPC